MALPGVGRSSPRRPSKRVWPVLAAFVLTALYFSIQLPLLSNKNSQLHVRVPLHAVDTLAKCRSLSVKPAPAPGFSDRTKSDRYERGTRSVLIRNATIWTGLDGGDVVHGDILLESGLIKNVGDASVMLDIINVTEIDAEVSMVDPY